MRQFSIFGLTFILAVARYNSLKMQLVIMGHGRLKSYDFPRPLVLWANFKGRVRFYLNCLSPLPAYFEVYRRDCDLCESTNYYRYPLFILGYLELKREAELWDEGPFCFGTISKKEYLESTPQTRDRILEAFENGRGTNVDL
jgi:hypothetical protein